MSVKRNEYIGIKQATKQGYITCCIPGVADFAYPTSTLRRGRVQGGGKVSPTLLAGEPSVCKIIRVRGNKCLSEYVIQAQKETDMQ